MPLHVRLLSALCAIATLGHQARAVAPSTKHKEIYSTPELEALREQNRQLRFNHAPPSPSKNELKSFDFHFSRIDARGRTRATPYRSSFPPPPPSECAPHVSTCPSADCRLRGLHNDSKRQNAVHEWMLPKAEREAFRAQQYRESHPEKYRPPAPQWMMPPPSPPKVKTKLLYAFHEGVTDSLVREDKRERHRKQLAEEQAMQQMARAQWEARTGIPRKFATDASIASEAKYPTNVADEGVAPSKHPLFGEDHLRDEALMKPVKGHRIPKDGQTPLKLFDKEELLAQMGWQQATKHSKRYTLTDQGIDYKYNMNGLHQDPREPIGASSRASAVNELRRGRMVDVRHGNLKGRGVGVTPRAAVPDMYAGTADRVHENVALARQRLDAEKHFAWNVELQGRRYDRKAPKDAPP